LTVGLYSVVMHCPKCGALNDDLVTFCIHCGTAVQTASLDLGTTTDPNLATVQYAGFWKRLGAYFIDQFVMQIPYILVIPVILVVGIFMPESWAKTAMIYAFMILYGLAYLLYGPLMESSRNQATLGKQALGIVVTDGNGERISFARAIGRNLGKIISALPYYAGFVAIAFTDKKQGFHDMMAGCLVVVKK
jgi:uncharacterized RDD family membrane protein YckC